MVLMVILIPKKPNERGIDNLKMWTLRMPEEVYEWLMEKAARETIRRKQKVSMNGLTVEILTRAMKADKKKRRGRNPWIGEDLMLEARRVVRFKCSERLREKVNGKG